jgi:hypothetical protein
MTTLTQIDGYNITEYDNKNIYIIENILSEELCKKIIDLINDFEEKKLLKNTVKDQGYNVVKCNFIELDKYDTTYSVYDREIYEIYHTIFSVFKKYNNDIIINGDTKYILRKIYDRTDLHTDHIRAIESICFYNQVRTLAAIICLNDDYDGGVFNFPKQNVSLKLKAGSVILFPPFWTHPHEISGLGKNQFRYTITTWATEDIINYET